MARAAADIEAHLQLDHGSVVVGTTREAFVVTAHGTTIARAQTLGEAIDAAKTLPSNTSEDEVAEHVMELLLADKALTGAAIG